MISNPKSAILHLVIEERNFTKFGKSSTHSNIINPAEKMKFPIMDFFSKCDQSSGFGHIY